jgi:TolB-like protein
MASIIPGYEYDIFISYRQKDNKYDGWVTEFVSNLKKELAATIKEDVSIYFDENPYDGIQENQIVDKTLEQKLKSLIFIPVISRTYCDPKSYAWQKELMVFNKLANQDIFGRDIRLRNGNYASRILPVKIHEIDLEDKTLLENEFGGVLGTVEFIFKSPGVNRPLKPDDPRFENMNHTYYRDQINKVANAINEIIYGLKYYRGASPIEFSDSNALSKKKFKFSNSKSFKIKASLLLIILVGVLISAYIIFNKKKYSEVLEKSIAVLPFENMSNDLKQDYFSDCMMEEILNHLFMIGGLKIPSSTSSMRFRGSPLSVREIAKELNVSYLLEGNVSNSEDSVRIIVSLINGKNEQLLWTGKYRRGLSAINLFEIQSEVAQKVADNMKVFINPEARKRIDARPTLNTEAYNLFLESRNKNLPFDQSILSLNKAIDLDPGYADAYAYMGILWLYQGGHGGKISRHDVLEKAEPLINKSLELNNNSILAHTAKATLSLYYYWDFKSVEKEFQIFNKLNPSFTDLKGYFSDYLLASGKFSDAYVFTENAFSQNKSSFNNWVQMALTCFYNNQPEKTYEIIDSANKLFPNEDFVILNSVRLFTYLAKYNEAIAFFDKNIPDKKPEDLIPYYLGHMGIDYYKTGRTVKSDEYLKELRKRSGKSAIGSPSFFAAAIYSAEGENDKAIQSLEKAYNDHEVEMYWLKVEPLFNSLRGDPRFKNLIHKIGFD